MSERALHVAFRSSSPWAFGSALLHQPALAILALALVRIGHCSAYVVLVDANPVSGQDWLVA
jgi:hypothetical protein